jgi:threonine/homoserine/homoserine lactone efflux protein
MSISTETLLAFGATSLAIELTPGPNMAYLAVISARTGLRAGFAAVLGITLGLLAMGIAAALGLSALIAGSRWAYEALRWAGVSYLLWLAWEGWHEADGARFSAEGVRAADSKFFVRGLITNMLNPKAGIFYVTILPTFIDESRPIIEQAVTLSVVYVAIAGAVHSAIVLLADSAGHWLANERYRIAMSRFLSLLLVAIAIWLFVTTGYGAVTQHASRHRAYRSTL